MLSVIDYITTHGDQDGGVRYSGIVHVGPQRFRELTGIVADYTRADGDDRPSSGRPVSVVYEATRSGYARRRQLESYRGPYQLPGPLGGMPVDPATPITFVVTRS